MEKILNNKNKSNSVNNTKVLSNLKLPKISVEHAYNLKFFQQPNTLQLAKQLLGSILATKINGKLTAGIIIETEPYMGSFDKASHAYKNKKTQRTKIQFEAGGYNYIFFVYGMYYQYCIVTNKKDIPDAILIRSILPITGLKTMVKRRYFFKKYSKEKLKKVSSNYQLANDFLNKFKDEQEFFNFAINSKNKIPNFIRNLANGPGKLTIALDITNKQHENLANKPSLWMQPFLRFKPNDIVAKPRIGIDYAQEYAKKPWRFYVNKPEFIKWVSVK